MSVQEAEKSRKKDAECYNYPAMHTNITSASSHQSSTAGIIIFLKPLNTIKSIYIAYFLLK
jgi:hypothetical protein